MWHPDSVFDEAGHLDEGVVHAWLDGALASEPAAQIEAHGSACDVCAARIAEARGLMAGARRVLAALDEPAVSAAPVWRLPVQRPGSVGRSPRWTTRRASIAAAAGLMLAVGSLVVSDQLGRGTGLRRPAVLDTAASAPQADVTPESRAGQAAPGSPVPVPTPSADAGSPASANPAGATPASADPSAVRARTAPAPMVAAPQGPPAPAPSSATDVAQETRRRSNAPDSRERSKMSERMAADAGGVPASALAAAPAAAVDVTRSTEAATEAGRATAEAALRSDAQRRLARSRSVQVAAESLPDRGSGVVAATQAPARISGQVASAAADRAADRAGQVSGGDSARRLFSAPAQLEEIVVTGLASVSGDSSRAAGMAILSGCWRLSGSDSLITFDPSTGPDGRQERARSGASSENRTVAALLVNGRRSLGQWEATVDSAGSLRLFTAGSGAAGALVIRRERLSRTTCP